MERLTSKNGWLYPMDSNQIKAIYDRLAAYEEIELTPEEIENTFFRFSSLLCELTHNRMSKTNYTLKAMLSLIEEMREEDCEKYCDLKKADNDGRLAELPCNIRDKVYLIETVYQ